jgi:DNA polymerase-3 subunit delta
MGERAIAEELGLRAFFVKNYLQQASNFTIPTLCKALEDCAKCDIDFKSGKITDRLGVEVIIMKYSRISK